MCPKSQTANFWGLFWCYFPYFRGIFWYYLFQGSVILRWVFWCQSTQIWWTGLAFLLQHTPKKGNGRISSGYPYRYPSWLPGGSSLRLRPTWLNWNAKALGTWDALSKKLMVQLKAHRTGKRCFFERQKRKCTPTWINTNQSSNIQGNRKSRKCTGRMVVLRWRILLSYEWGHRWALFDVETNDLDGFW